MTKHEEVLRSLADSGGEVDLIIPGIGITLGTIESVEDDVATVAMSGGVRAALHVSQVGLLLGK